MQTALKLTARVLPGKRVEFTAPELTVGEDVELIVLKSDKPGPPLAHPFSSAWEYLQSLKPVARTPEEWETVERELQVEKDSWERRTQSTLRPHFYTPVLSSSPTISVFGAFPA